MARKLVPVFSCLVALWIATAWGQRAAAFDPQIERAKVIVRWLNSGEHGRLRKEFDGAMLRAFPDDAALASWWRGVEKQTGKFREHFGARREMTGGYSVVIFTSIFSTAPWDVRVSFTDKGEIGGLQVSACTDPSVRPQTPRPPFPYATLDASYDNPEGGNRITGTLTIPAGDGPHPAVLLISGSGSQDRDGTMAGHKPFLVIADHLSRRGIAVLRVDDRGVGGSTGDPEAETIALIASDVEAGLAFLERQNGIDARRIGLIGHSVGGLVGPMIAARSTKVAFVVSLAGPAVSGVELVPLQVAALLDSQGVPEAVIADIVAAYEALWPLVVADAPESVQKPAIARLVEAGQRVVPDDADPRVKEALRIQMEKRLLGPWNRSFARSDPGRHLRRVTVPILVMFGDKDVVVPADMNLQRAKQALAKSGNEDVRFEKLPGLNHLFQRAETGATDEFVLLTDTFDKGALDLMTEWLLETVKL